MMQIIKVLLYLRNSLICFVMKGSALTEQMIEPLSLKVITPSFYGRKCLFQLLP